MINTFFVLFFTVFLTFNSFQSGANEYQVINEAKLLFKKGQYQQAEQLLSTLDQPMTAETHYLLAIINDPEYHYISIQPGYPSYDEIRDEKAKFHYKQAVNAGHCLAHFYQNQYQLSRHSKRWVSRSTTTYSTNRNRRYKNIKKCLQEPSFSENPEALYMLSRLVTADTPEPGKKAMPMFHKVLAMAESGDAYAQYYLGRMYIEGYFRLEEMRDYIKAFAWLTTAAYQGVHLSGVYAFYVFEEKLEDDKKQSAQVLAGQYINKYIQQ